MIRIGYIAMADGESLRLGDLRNFVSRLPADAPDDLTIEILVVGWTVAEGIRIETDESP